MTSGKRSLLTRETPIAVLFALIVAFLRLLLARPLHFCGTPDACYYLGMAQTLSSGHGFHARFLYDFQQAHPTLPNTGIEYWRPGISLLLWAFRGLGTATLHGSIALTILVGLLYAAAAWHLAMHFARDRRLALASFALCLLSSPAWGGSLTPDSGLYYGAAVAWFLALFTVRRQGLLHDLLALLCVSAAYLIRNDAAVLLLPLLAVLWERRRRASAAGEAMGGSSAPYALAMLLGFVLALLPMHALYRAVLGTAFPSGTARAFFLNDLGDFDRYNDPATLHSLLSHGLKHLLLFRVSTFATVVYRIAVLMIGYAALIFLPALFPRPGATQTEAPRTGAPQAGAPQAGAQIGAVEQGADPSRRLPELTGALTFFVAALLAYTLVLPAIGGFSALRTAVGVMPLAAVLVMIAIRRAATTAKMAAVLAVAVVAANALSGLMDVRREIPAANAIADGDRAEADALAQLGADPARAVVLTADPVQFSVTTGYSTAALPSNGLDAIAHAAHDLGATHVMLNTEALPATFDELNRRLHPVRSVNLLPEHTWILVLPPASEQP